MNSVTVHINNLPSEILLHIFSYLPTSDLVVCVTKVCTRWNTLPYGRKLWLHRKVDLPEDTSMQALVKCFSKCPSVGMILDFDRRSGTASIYDKYLFAIIHTQDGFLSFLTTIIKNGDYITYISVSGVNNGLDEVLKIIANLPNLQTLVMNGSDSADNSGIRHLTDNCPHLKKVDTGEIVFSQEEVKYFLTKKKNQLTHIGFSLQVAKGVSLLPFLAVCGNKLISLDIYGSTGISTTLVRYMTVFRSLKKLERLSFQNDIKFGKGVLAKAFTSGWFLNLRTLTILTANYVDDEVVAAICLNCPLLRDLQILESEITGEGLKYLNHLQNLQILDLSLSDCLGSLGTLSHCVQLQRLNLAHCMFVCPREIAVAVPHLHELRHLDLTFCELSHLCLRELPKRLPFLRSFILFHTDVEEEQVDIMKLCAPHIEVMR